MIEASGLRFRYGPSAHVLRDVSLRLETGLTLLVGPNGCGKTTLMRVLAGIERPEAGTIRVDGHDLWVEEAQSRAGLAYLPERPDVTPYASVRELLLLVARLRSPRGSDSLLSELPDLIERVGLAGLENRTLTRLSQGQRRRVLLAATLLGEPNNLLLDEPLEALDIETKALFMQWLDRRLEAGATAVVISHTIEPFVPLATVLATVKQGTWSSYTVDELEQPGASAERLALGARI